MFIKSHVTTPAICLCILSLLFLCACGQVPDTAPDSQGGIGGYSPHLVFPEDFSRKENATKALNGFSCEEEGIVTIKFNFISNGWQYGPRSFRCEDRHASISGVPAGRNVIVEVFADNAAGNALYEGSEVVDIVRNQVTTGGGDPDDAC